MLTFNTTGSLVFGNLTDAAGVAFFVRPRGGKENLNNL